MGKPQFRSLSNKTDLADEEGGRMYMKKVYFIRHSIRDMSVTHEMAPLTKEGVQLAEEIAPYFVNKKIQQVFSSPFQRTIDTLRPTARTLELPIIEVVGLRERKVGGWLETNFDSYAEKQWRDFDYKIENGESLNEVKKRIVPAFQEIITRVTGDCIICGHGTAFSVLFHELTKGIFAYEQFKTLKMPDVFVGEFDHNQQLIHFQNIKYSK